MNDLIEFLLARIAEDEELTREADHIYVHPGAHDPMFGARPSDEVASRYWDRIADPDRVLADLNAKREMIKRARRAVEAGDYVATTGGSDRPEARSDRTWYLGAGMAWQQVLRLLALPYADYPGYRQEWKP